MRESDQGTAKAEIYPGQRWGAGVRVPAAGESNSSQLPKRAASLHRLDPHWPGPHWAAQPALLQWERTYLWGSQYPPHFSSPVLLGL